jgi:hypothetical protein
MKKLGIIKAVHNVVSKNVEAAGFEALVAEGMQDMLFEIVVVRHPSLFSATAVEKSSRIGTERQQWPTVATTACAAIRILAWLFQPSPSTWLPADPNWRRQNPDPSHSHDSETRPATFG